VFFSRCYYEFGPLKLWNLLVSSSGMVCWFKNSGPVDSTPEKFENSVFPVRTQQMFSVHATPEKFENATITGHSGFVFEENSRKAGKSHDYPNFDVFEKLRFQNVFSVSTRKRKASGFQFLRFEEHFRKASFSWGISVDGRADRRNKAAVSNFSGVVWTGLRLKFDVAICFSPYLSIQSRQIKSLFLSSVHRFCLRRGEVVCKVLCRKLLHLLRRVSSKSLRF